MAFTFFSLIKSFRLIALTLILLPCSVYSAQCPSCKSEINDFDKITYCPVCNQALLFHEEAMEFSNDLEGAVGFTPCENINGLSLNFQDMTIAPPPLTLLNYLKTHPDLSESLSCNNDDGYSGETYIDHAPCNTLGCFGLLTEESDPDNINQICKSAEKELKLRRIVFIYIDNIASPVIIWTSESNINIHFDNTQNKYQKELNAFNLIRDIITIGNQQSGLCNISFHSFQAD